MITSIKINSKQLQRLTSLIKTEKLPFNIMGSEKINPAIGEIDLRVILNSLSDDPSDLFDLGVKYKSTKDTITL